MRGEKSSEASEARDAGSHLFLLAERSVTNFFSTTIPLYSPSKKHRYNDFEGIFCAASDPVGRRQKGSAGAQLEPQRLLGVGGASLVVR